MILFKPEANDQLFSRQLLLKSQAYYQLLFSYKLKMEEFGFRKSGLFVSQPLQPQPQPLQHLLPPELPFGNQYNKFLVYNSQSISSQRGQIQKYEEMLTERDSKIKILETKLQQVEKQLRRSIQLTNFTQMEKIEAVERLRSQEMIIASTRDKYEELLRMCSEEENVVDLEKQNKVLALRVRKLEKDLIDKQKELLLKNRMFEEKNQESRKLLDRLHNNVEKKEEKLNRDLEESLKQVASLKQAVLEYKQEVENSKKHKLQLGIRIEQLQMTRQLSESRSKRILESTQSKLNQTQINEQFWLNRHANDVKQLQEIIQELRQELGQQREESQLLKLEVGQYQDQRRDQEAILIETQEKLNKFQEYLDRLQYEKTALEGKVQVLEVDVVNSELRIIQETQEKKTLLQQKQLLKRELENMDTKCKSLTQELQTLRIQIKEKDALTENLKEQLSLKDKTINQHFQRMSNLEIQKKDINHQMSQLQNQLKSLQGQYRYIQQKLKDTSIKYSKSQRLLQMYKQESSKPKRSTQDTWYQLKEVYEEQIEVLERRLKDYQNRSYQMRRSMSNSGFIEGKTCCFRQGKENLWQATNRLQKDQE